MIIIQIKDYYSTFSTFSTFSAWFTKSPPSLNSFKDNTFPSLSTFLYILVKTPNFLRKFSSLCLNSSLILALSSSSTFQLYFFCKIKTYCNSVMILWSKGSSLADDFFLIALFLLGDERKLFLKPEL